MNTSATYVPSLWRSLLRAVGWCGLGLMLVAVFLSDFVARAPAGAADPNAMLGPPSPVHPFGTDLLGRDMLSETLHGLAQTGGHAILAALIVIVCGGLFGSVAARLPRPLAFGLRGVLGVFAAIPALLLTILVIGLTARFYAPLAAGLAAAPWAFVRAFDRADTGSTHAEYARATGIPAMTLLRRDLSHEFRDILGSAAARALAAVTIILSTASFLGFGAEPPARDLGLMIAAGKATYLVAWWTAAVPAAALVIVVLCARLAAGLDEGERP
jgi:peptide/nickel transport system permease protein